MRYQIPGRARARPWRAAASGAIHGLVALSLNLSSHVAAALQAPASRSPTYRVEGPLEQPHTGVARGTSWQGVFMERESALVLEVEIPRQKPARVDSVVSPLRSPVQVKQALRRRTEGPARADRSPAEQPAVLVCGKRLSRLMHDQHFAKTCSPRRDAVGERTVGEQTGMPDLRHNQFPDRRHAFCVDPVQSFEDADLRGAESRQEPLEVAGRRAEAIPIFPSTLKGGFIFGGHRGKGILSVRERTTGTWSAPAFLTLTGGSFGAQIGGQAVDVVLVIVNRRGLEQLLQNQFKIGAGAAVTAGPIGRDAEASTDIQLRAEILSYSRARGPLCGFDDQGLVHSRGHDRRRLRGTGLAVQHNPGTRTRISTAVARGHVSHHLARGIEGVRPGFEHRRFGGPSVAAAGRAAALLGAKRPRRADGTFGT